jgi:hypothetical protein
MTKKLFKISFLLILLIPTFFPILGNSIQNDIPTISAKNLQFVNGEISSSYGEVITNIGDYDQDGFEDFIVGGRQYAGWRGKTWIYSTDLTGIKNKTPIFTIVGEPNKLGDGICFGHTAINAGDLNNDGVTDFIAGGPGSWGNWDVGKVYVFFGNQSTLPSQAGIHDNGQIVSPIKYDWLGETMSSLKDFNGDGFTDVLVGAPGSPSVTGSENPFDFGHAYIYFGSNNGLSLSPNITLNDEVNGTGFALTLNGEGDVDGDGLSDALVGGYNFDSDMGRAYLFFGSESSETNKTPDVIITAPENSYKFASNLAIINDLNNDGFDEIAVKSHSRPQFEKVSKTYIYLGNQERSFLAPDFIFSADIEYDDYGFALKGINDINNDGYNDFAIGAPGESASNYNGNVYIYYGSANIDINPDQMIIGENNGDEFGYAIGTIKLFNNGTNSILISSHRFNEGQGRAYLVADRKTGETDTISLTNSQTAFGFSFSQLIMISFLVVILRLKISKTNKRF